MSGLRLTSTFKQIIRNKEFNILLPSVYVMALILSFLLTLLYAAFPQLVTCSAFLGEEVCTPSGIFFFLIFSLPGYLVMGNIAYFLPQLPASITLFFVVGISGLTYFALGILLDKVIKMEKTTANISKLVIVLSVITLLLFLFFLL